MEDMFNTLIKLVEGRGAWMKIMFGISLLQLHTSMIMKKKKYMMILVKEVLLWLRWSYSRRNENYLMEFESRWRLWSQQVVSVLSLRPTYTCIIALDLASMMQGEHIGPHRFLSLQKGPNIHMMLLVTFLCMSMIVLWKYKGKPNVDILPL